MQSQVKFNGFRRRFRRRFQEALASQVSSRVLEKVAEKVPEKVLGIFGAGPGHVQKRLWRSLFFLPSLHASERVVKIKRAAVGDTTEAFFIFPKHFCFFRVLCFST